MNTKIFLAAVCLAFGSIAVAQPRGGGPCCGAGPAALAGKPTVELKGKVARVQITPGAGMPYLEVRTGEQITKVYLGSIRYLVAQGFNPKTDDEVVVKAYKLDSDMVAIRVTLPGENKTIQLRDEKGYPMWRGGRW